MIYPGKEIILKDSRLAILRAPKQEDAAEMIECLKKITGETEFLARYPEEVLYTPESEAAYLQNNLDSPYTMMIVCTVEGKIAGNCQLVFSDAAKVRHRATVMIGLLREYWNQGIGSALFSEMEQAAQERGVSQMELEMVEGNSRAFALYRKMGFEVMAELPDGFRLKDGSSRKAVFMRKCLI